MKLAIYVPKTQADMWTPDATDLSFDEFQRELIEVTGGITLTSATGKWNPPQAGEGFIEEPVFIVETLLPTNPPRDTYRKVWALLRSYAQQLLANGEQAVLVVQDNEPTFIKA